MRIAINLGAVGLILILQSCAPSFPGNPGFDAELADRSRNDGLGIVTTQPSSGNLPVAYFDHMWDQIHCCGRISQSWVTPGGRHLITLDLSMPSVTDLASGNAGLILSDLTANVILFDLHGVEQRRYQSRIRASFAAVSPDGNMIAFEGQGGPVGERVGEGTRGETRLRRGLLFGPIASAPFSIIYTLSKQGTQSGTGEERPGTISWSPDGTEIAYGKDRTVFVYNLQKRASRSLATGSNPFWSPDGNWISYRGPEGEAMLTDPSGRMRRQILEGQKIQYALHWSPDGRYLLLTLLNERGIIPWARLAVYRLSDGAITSIGDPGLSSLDDSGREWVLMGTRH